MNGMLEFEEMDFFQKGSDLVLVTFSGKYNLILVTLWNQWTVPSYWFPTYSTIVRDLTCKNKLCENVMH